VAAEYIAVDLVEGHCPWNVANRMGAVHDNRWQAKLGLLAFLFKTG
jgi:hypothetical protein